MIAESNQANDWQHLGRTRGELAASRHRLGPRWGRRHSWMTVSTCTGLCSTCLVFVVTHSARRTRSLTWAKAAVTSGLFEKWKDRPASANCARMTSISAVRGGARPLRNLYRVSAKTQSDRRRLRPAKDRTYRLPHIFGRSLHHEHLVWQTGR